MNKPLNALEFEKQNPEVRQRIIHAGKIAIGSFVQAQATSTGTANFALGSVLNLTSTVDFAIPQQAKPFFGNAYVSIYQGTVLNTSSQIYPVRGGSVTVGRYQVQGWYDLHTWDRVGNAWRGMVVDTSGTSSTVISFSVAWTYADYTLGTT